MSKVPLLLKLPAAPVGRLLIIETQHRWTPEHGSYRRARATYEDRPDVVGEGRDESAALLDLYGKTN